MAGEVIVLHPKLFWFECFVMSSVGKLLLSCVGPCHTPKQFEGTLKDKHRREVMNSN